MKTKKQIKDIQRKVKDCLQQIDINKFVEECVRCNIVTENELIKEDYLLAKQIIYALGKEIQFQFRPVDRKDKEHADDIYMRRRYV